MSTRFKPFPSSKASRRLPPTRGPRRTVGIRGHRQDAGADCPRAPLAARGRAAGIDPLPDLHQGGCGGNGEPHRRAPCHLGASSGQVLEKELFAFGQRTTPRPCERARQLFAQGARLPGRAKIQTIHAFAQSLLAAFPAEAGIVPGFQPIEGRAEQELVRRTLADLIADAEAQATSADPGRAVPQPPARRRRCRRVSAGAARKPEALAALGRAKRIEAKVRARMDLPEESVEDYIAHDCGDEGFDCDLFGRSPTRTANGARRRA